MKWTDINLETIRKEFSKIHDMKSFKDEMAHLGQELLKFQPHLGPHTKKNLKALERRYNQALKGVHAQQRRFDKEIVKARKVLEQTRKDVEKKFEGAKKSGLLQKNRLSKVIATQLSTTSKAKAKPKKKKARKTTAVRKKRAGRKSSAKRK